MCRNDATKLFGMYRPTPIKHCRANALPFCPLYYYARARANYSIRFVHIFQFSARWPAGRSVDVANAKHVKAQLPLFIVTAWLGSLIFTFKHNDGRNETQKKIKKNKKSVAMTTWKIYNKTKANEELKCDAESNNEYCILCRENTCEYELSNCLHAAVMATIDATASPTITMLPTILLILFVVQLWMWRAKKWRRTQFHFAFNFRAPLFALRQLQKYTLFHGSHMFSQNEIGRKWKHVECIYACRNGHRDMCTRAPMIAFALTKFTTISFRPIKFPCGNGEVMQLTERKLVSFITTQMNAFFQLNLQSRVDRRMGNALRQ